MVTHFSVHWGGLFEWVPTPWQAVWARAVSEGPTRVALEDARDGSVFLVSELDELSRRAVTLLRSWGLGPGDRLVVVDSGEPESALLVSGALRLGAAALLLAADSPEARAADAAREAGAAVVVTASPNRRGWPALRDPGLARALGEAEPSAVLPDVPLDAPAVALYSSGSTGPAKGVMLTHGELQRGFIRLRSLLPARPLRQGLPARLHTITGLRLALLAPLMSGDTPVLLAPNPSPSALLADVGARALDTLHTGPGFVLGWLAGRDGMRAPAPASLKWVFVGGGGLEDAERRAFAEAFGVTVVHTYGATETAGAVAAIEVHPGQAAPPGYQPIAPMRIVGDDGRELARGEVGRIEVELGDRWVSPGDIGRLDEAGRLVVHGRVTRLWASPAGLKVQLEDLEALIRAETGREVIVSGTASLGVLLEGDDLGEAWLRRIRERLRARLPEYAVPTRWAACRALPRLPGGKCDLVAAARMLEET